jgi:hypothetical protein
MKYLKIFIILTLSIFSLKSEAQKRFKVTSRLGYTAITNAALTSQDAYSTYYSDNQFILSVLLKKKISNKFSFRPGLSVSRWSAESGREYNYIDGIVDVIYEDIEVCYLLDLFFEHSLKNKFINNIYYGPNLGLGVYSYQTTYIWQGVSNVQDFSDYNELRINFNAGVEINLIKNTNAYIELGYLRRGLLTIGISHNFFNKTEDVFESKRQIH